MIIIKCKGQSIESVLKTYRQKVDRTRQLVELKSRKEFEKPSVKRRKLKQRAQYKSRQNNVKL
jgi:small subunit ribosomal protein S21